MKLIKKINNNFALGVDDNGEQLIVEGKGIGFQKMPCVISDYALITRTYYDFDEQYVSLIKEIDERILRVANRIFEYACERIPGELNPNLPFILADHLNFAITRKQKGIHIDFPIYYDLLQLYPKEAEVAEYALKELKRTVSVSLDEQEKSGIVMNLINAESFNRNQEKNQELNAWIQYLVHLVETKMQIQINKDSFNYTRFVTHVNYLYSRISSRTHQLNTDNQLLYTTLVKQFPLSSECVDQFTEYLKKTYHILLSDEEKLYLILHVNRLCEREKDCNSVESEA